MKFETILGVLISIIGISLITIAFIGGLIRFFEMFVVN